MNQLAPKDALQRAYITAGEGILINRVGEKDGNPIVEVTLAPDVVAALNVLKTIVDTQLVGFIPDDAGCAGKSHNVVCKIDDETAAAIFSDIMNRKAALDVSAPIL